MRAKASEAVSKVADVAQETGRQAKEVASDAQQKAKSLLNMQVNAGAELAGHVAQSARCAAADLDRNAPQLAELVRGAAERVENFSRDMRHQTVEDLVRTASDFTRRQPALVFGLASLAGFLALRVLKSNPPRRSEDPYRRSEDQYYRGERFGGASGQFHGT
jgi:ElaB/YqjD/DUF883 family membrane-anchored ribosome-binding protein